MKILVTGGAGYIGSHVVCELLTGGHEVLVVDDLSNSYPEQLDAVRQVTGKPVQLDVFSLSNVDLLSGVFAREKPDAVIHCAGLKSVPESVASPLLYYRENIGAALALIQVMMDHGCRKLVFSSSAAVYGKPASLPITEESPPHPESPYGWTKLIIEQALNDVSHADPSWRIAALRYFNPAGAHPSFAFGENAKSENNALLSALAKAALDPSHVFSVFGGAYPTKDGTAIRDLIHIVDLARAHGHALKILDAQAGMNVFNLGTGHGYTVLEVLREFEQASGQKIAHQIVSARPGDIPISFTDPTRAKTTLHWVADHTLHDICRDAWRWTVKSGR